MCCDTHAPYRTSDRPVYARRLTGDRALLGHLLATQYDKAEPAVPVVFALAWSPAPTPAPATAPEPVEEREAVTV